MLCLAVILRTIRGRVRWTREGEVESEEALRCAGRLRRQSVVGNTPPPPDTRLYTLAEACMSDVGSDAR